MNIGRIGQTAGSIMPKGKVVKKQSSLPMAGDKVSISGSRRDDKMQTLKDIADKGGKQSLNGYGDNFLGPVVDLGIGTIAGGILGGLGGAAVATGVAASLLTGAAGVIVGGAIGFGLAMGYVNRKFH